MRRILLLLAVVAMLVLGLAPAAQAQTFNERTPLTGTFVNPCTGEEIIIEGTLHLVARFEEDSSGGLHIVFHNDFHGQGVSDSGAKYVIESQGPAMQHTYIGDQGTPVSFTVVSHVNFIRQGETGTEEEDFMGRVLTHATVNANGELTTEFVTVDIECQ